MIPRLLHIRIIAISVFLLAAAVARGGVAKLRCSMTDGELEDFASVCRTASLTASTDEYDRGGGHRHYLYWDGLGNHLSTSYETAVTPPAAGQVAGRTRRTAIRAYHGDGYVLRGTTVADSLEMLRFDGGYFDTNLRPHYLVADYLGANIAVIDENGTLVQTTSYYPYGEPHRAPKNLVATASPTTNHYLFGGKELMTQDALDEYLYGARTYLPSAIIFTSSTPSVKNTTTYPPTSFAQPTPYAT